MAGSPRNAVVGGACTAGSLAAAACICAGTGRRLCEGMRGGGGRGKWAAKCLMLPLRSSSTPRLEYDSAWFASTEIEILKAWYASPRSPMPMATYVRGGGGGGRREVIGTPDGGRERGASEGQAARQPGRTAPSEVCLVVMARAARSCTRRGGVWRAACGRRAAHLPDVIPHVRHRVVRGHR